MKYQLSQEDFERFNNGMMQSYGLTIGFVDGDDFYIDNNHIVSLESQGKNPRNLFENLLSKTLEEADISDSRIYRLYDYMQSANGFKEIRKVPFDILFNKQLDIFLYKGAVEYDHRGRPVSVTYYQDASEEIPVVKREWEFADFEKNTIMVALGIPESVASSIEDRLVWTRKEIYSWAFKDGTWSSDTKVLFENYVPFVGQIPDYARYYEKRVEERKIARQIILDRMQPKVVAFIAQGLQTNDLDEVRAVGRAFLQKHSSDFYEYIQTGDELVINNIIEDQESVMLDYSIDIAGVNLRQWIVNTLRQTGDLEMPI